MSTPGGEYTLRIWINQTLNEIPNQRMASTHTLPRSVRGGHSTLHIWVVSRIMFLLVVMSRAIGTGIGRLSGVVVRRPVDRGLGMIAWVGMR